MVVRVAVCVFHFAIAIADSSVLAPFVADAVAAADSGVARVDAVAVSSLLCGSHPASTSISSQNEAAFVCFHLDSIQH